MIDGFVCSEYAYKSVYYVSTTCSSLFLAGTWKFGIGCAYQNQYYYNGADSYSYSLQCTTSTNIPLDATVTYALESAYDSTSGCSSSALSGFNAYKDSLCFSRPAEYPRSFKYTYPNMVTYSGPTCSGSQSTSALATTCDINSADDFYESYFSYGHIERSFVWSQVVGSATGRPSLLRKF